MTAGLQYSRHGTEKNVLKWYLALVMLCRRELEILSTKIYDTPHLGWQKCKGKFVMILWFQMFSFTFKLIYSTWCGCFVILNCSLRMFFSLWRSLYYQYILLELICAYMFLVLFVYIWFICIALHYVAYVLPSFNWCYVFHYCLDSQYVHHRISIHNRVIFLHANRQ